MNKKILFSLVALNIINIDAQMLNYSVKGYDNAIANGWSLYENYDKSVKACFENKFNATDKIWDKYNKEDYKHINGNIIELCNYQQQIQYNMNDRYIVYCGNVERKFEDISNAQGWGGDLENEKASSKESLAYSSSVRDNSYTAVKFNQINSFSYNLKTHKKAMEVFTSNRNYQKIDIIEDGYKLYKVNTTGRISLNNNGNAIGYLLDHTPIKDDNLKEFYNVIVGSQYNELVSKKKYYQDAFNNVKGMTYNSKVLEKALLKNIKAIEYIGYVDYPIKWGNESKCYTFDITKYDRVNVSDNENMQKAIIRAKNFSFTPNEDYIFSNTSKQYSIHKSNARVGIYGKDKEEIYFSINVRANTSEAKGNVNFTFYPDAAFIEIEKDKVYLKDINNNKLLKRESSAEYHISGKGLQSCKLNIDNSTNFLVFNQGNCNLKQRDIQIIEKIGNYERPIFQTSGIDIIQGFVVTPETAEDLIFKTAYVDNDLVIKNNKVNKATKYGSAIYTTLANKEFYVQLDTTSNNETYIDFNPNGNFQIISAHDNNGVVEKIKSNKGCDGKYPAKQMVLKLLANNPKQINNLSYTQYHEVIENGVKVCKQLANKNGGYDFTSNDFAIRPAEFELGISKLTQEASTPKTISFTSNNLKDFNDLGIGIADLIVEYKDNTKAFALLNNERKKITIFANDARLNSEETINFAKVNKNGNFDLLVNFPLATEAKIELAETNFAKNDKNLGLCIGDIFDKDTANTQQNGKISCYIPMKNLLDIDFTSISKAENNEYLDCTNDITKCEGYNKESGLIDLVNIEDKIGIKNSLYNKIMLGDKDSLIYTLNLVSKNSNNKFIPTKFKDAINLVIDLGNLGDIVVNEGNFKKIEISLDELNAAYKKAFDNLNENLNLVNNKEYTKEEASYKNVSKFSFKKDEIMPVQKITLSAYVDGVDNFHIAYNNAYDVAYTGLVFKDIKSNAKSKTLEYPKDCEFGYYDKVGGRLVFIKDNKLKLKNVLEKVSFSSDYKSTIVNNYTLTTNTNSQYIKDTIRFNPKAGYEYLSNHQNSFTIEFK